MITVSIASVANPERLKCLRKTLSALLSQDTIPHIIDVHLEDYIKVPPSLSSQYPTCNFIIEPLSGGLTSYKSFDNVDTKYCLSLDDDLIFPDNFITRVIQHLEHVGKTACISFLSKYYPDISSCPLYDEYIPVHFNSGCPGYTPCHILGSGVAAFHSSYIAGCFDYAYDVGVQGIFRDMLVSYFLWISGVSILRPPSTSDFLLGRPCVINCNEQKTFKDRQEVLDALYKRGFLNPTSFGSLK